MTRIFAISIFFIFCYQLVVSQEIKKEKIYLLFKKSHSKRFKSLGYKFINNKGINFNLNKNAFLNKSKMKKDTLCLHHLKEYKLTDINSLKLLEKKWYKRNSNYFAQYYKKNKIPHPPLNRNGIFDIYIIEKINNKQMVIYQVKFRNEGNIQ